MDAAGNLYGNTSQGARSTSSHCPYGCGSTFELSPSSSGWNLSLLHSYSDGFDGANPYGGLLLDASGNLYGATNTGGSQAYGCSNGYQQGCGVVFKISPASAASGSSTASTPSRATMDLGPTATWSWTARATCTAQPYRATVTETSSNWCTRPTNPSRAPHLARFGEMWGTRSVRERRVLSSRERHARPEDRYESKRQDAVDVCKQKAASINVVGYVPGSTR